MLVRYRPLWLPRFTSAVGKPAAYNKLGRFENLPLQYIWDDKMVITFNYKDNDKAVTFDEIREMLAKRGNPDNHNDYQGSPLKVAGDP